MTDLRRTLQDSTRDEMWSGDIERLTYLVEECAEIADASKKALLSSELDEFQRGVVEKADFFRLTMTVKLAQHDEEIKGAPAEVIEEIRSAPEEVKSIELRFGFQTGGERDIPAHSGFRLYLGSFGAQATAFGFSRDWINGTKLRFERALKADRPWYAWTRRWWGFVVVVSVPAFFAMTVAISAINAATQSPWWAIIIMVPVWTAYLYFAMRVWPRLVPMFELTRPHARARSAIALSALGTGALFILGSVLLPIWLR